MLVWMQWFIGSNRLMTTAEMRDKCSPRWIVYHNLHAVGAQQLGGVTTQQECLQACVNSSLCTAADWDRSLRQCWLHATDSQYNLNDRYNSYDVTAFEIVRGCETESGIIILHSLRSVIVTVYSVSTVWYYSQCVLCCWKMSVRPSVCLSVRHTLVFSRNG